MLIQLPNDAISVGYKETRPFHHEQIFKSAKAQFTGTAWEFVRAGHAYAYDKLDTHTRRIIRCV